MAISVQLGTYYQAINFAGSTAHHIVFLRPSGRFLVLGYWRGYERSAAAGEWRQSGRSVTLSGHGDLQTDDLSSPPTHRYARRFESSVVDGVTALRAEEELTYSRLDGW